MSRPRLPPTALPLALSLALSALATAARADEKEQATKLFDQGLSQMEAKKYDLACPAIEESQKKDPHPGTLFTLAECEALRGRPAVAYARYGEYLEVHASLPRDKQAKQGTRERDARASRARLEKLIARVTLALPPSAPAGTTVTVDDRPAEIGPAIALDPGAHLAVTRAPDGTTTERRFTVDKAQETTLTLEVRTAPAPRKPPLPPPTATPSPPSSGARIGAFIAGGVGLAGLVAGGVTGGLMLSKKDVVDASCKDGGEGVKLCDAAGVEAGNSAKLLGTVATIGLAVGAAGVGLSVVLFAVAPKRPAPGETKGGALEVRLSSAGPAGTMVGVRGSF